METRFCRAFEFAHDFTVAVSHGQHNGRVFFCCFCTQCIPTRVNCIAFLFLNIFFTFTPLFPGGLNCFWQVVGDHSAKRWVIGNIVGVTL